MKYKITLGPCLFNWLVNDWRDFYYKIADETDVDEVYLGEVVCFKRDPFFAVAMEDVVNRLQSGGKKVIYSTMGLLLGGADVKRAQTLAKKSEEGFLVEVNDLAVMGYLKDKPSIIGPNVNVYNEAALESLVSQGAVRVCLPGELNKDTVKILAEKNPKETEVFVFGRLPLAIATRCYHARLHGTGKKSCGYVCEQDYNGLVIKTITNEDFLAINGTQTMSSSYVNLVFELKELIKFGVNSFRISPHYMNMKRVIELFRGVLDNKIEASQAYLEMEKLLPEKAKFSNGFFHGTAGREFQQIKDLSPTE